MRRALSLLMLLSACRSTGAGDAGGLDAGLPADAQPDAAPPVDATPTDAPGVDAPAPDAADGGGGGLTIGAWNLEQFPLTPATIDRVAPLIEEQGYDLLGIEEITDPDAFATLDERLSDYTAVIAFDDAPMRVGFLYRPDRLEVSDIDLLFQGDSYAFPRPVLKASVRVMGGDFDFVFMVLHLKARIDAESRARRQAAVEQLATWLTDQLATSTEQDYVLVGDLNDQITDPPAENVFEPLLSRPETFRFLTQEAAEAGEVSYITFRQMIDHVLVTTDALDEYGTGTTEVLHLDETVSGYTDEISDHRPVAAHFQLP